MHAIKKNSNSNPSLREDGFLYSYRQIPANKIVADPSYNRPINRSQVEDIIKKFDPNLVNPCKVSNRDGKYYIFDGNHTLRALIERNNGDDSLYIDCKCYEGMTREDEARMFAKQNGTSRKVTSSYQLRALYVAKDQAVLDFKSAINKAGAECTFTATNSPKHIKCYDTAFSIYKKYGKNHIIAVVDSIMRAWKGNPDSLRREIINGVSTLLITYRDIDRDRLVSQISKEPPSDIIVNGKADKFHSGNKRFAAQLALLYNKRRSQKLDLSLLS